MARLARTADADHENPTLLAPDIQEQILFLPAVNQGRDPLKGWQVRPVAAEALWGEQRKRWKQLAW